MSLSIPTMSAIRFGYGIRPGEAPIAGAADLLAQLARGVAEIPLYPTEGVQGRFETIRSIQKRQRAATAVKKSGDKEKFKKLRKAMQRETATILARDVHARFQQAVLSPNGFYERLVVFWSNHFSVSSKKRRPMRVLVSLFEARAIRPNIAGSFNNLLKAAVLDPAMLIYLDQIKSVGPGSISGKNNDKGLNENLGRELLELHTLGVDGGYDQDDVRAASLVLTGMGVNNEAFQTQFKRRAAEPGPQTVMGMSFGKPRRSQDDVEAMLDALAGMAQTARHICRKLVIHFIADDPPEAVVDAMTKAWADSDGDLTSVYRAMLDHPLAWENGLVKARQPFDYIVAGLRAVNAKPRDIDVPPGRNFGDGEEENTVSPMLVPPDEEQNMQATENAGPGDAENDGEDGEQPKMMAEKKVGGKKRGAGNPLTVGAAIAMGQPTWQPSSPAGWEEAFDVWVSSSQLTERITWARLVAGQFGNKSDPRELVKLVLADAARADTIQIVNQAPSTTAGTTYILASPEFNRR